MKSNLKLENYPHLRIEALNKYLNIIHENKNHWKNPFFTDTQTHIDFNEMAQALEEIKIDHLENIIVLGTGGSIQTLLALKHIGKKRIYPITSSRSVELINCLEETDASNSLVIPISRGGETLDIN